MPDQKAENASEERRSTLGEDLGALIFSIVMLFGGGLLLVSDWGNIVHFIGGVLALIGVVTTPIMFWALLKNLWRGGR